METFTKLWAGTPGPAHFNCAEVEQPNASMQGGEAIGEVVDPWIELEVAADRARLRASALVDQLFHSGDRRETLNQVSRKNHRPPPARRWIGVDGQDAQSPACVGVGQEGGQRRLPHTPLAGHRDLHLISPRQHQSYRTRRAHPASRERPCRAASSRSARMTRGTSISSRHLGGGLKMGSLAQSVWLVSALTSSWAAA